MADGEQEPILWCNKAEPTRERWSYVWNEHGVRVPNIDPETGAHRKEKIPQQPHLGTPLFGFQQLKLRRSVKVLRHDGHVAEIVTTNSAAHINDNDNSYERYQLGRKGRNLGWIPEGSCPAAMIMMGQIMPGTIKAPAAKDGQPCSAAQVGYGKPPCHHYRAELGARVGANTAAMLRAREALKSEEAKLLEGQVKVQKEATAATNATLEKVAGVLDHLVASVGKPEAKSGK